MAIKFIGSINGKVLIVSSIATLCIIFTIYSFRQTINLSELRENSNRRLNEISRLFYEIAIIEHDFYEFETINPAFYTTKNSTLLQQCELNFEKIDSDLTILGEQLELQDQEKLTKLKNEILQNSDKQKRNYQIFVALLLKRGFQDYGLEGKMRKEIHHLQNENPLGTLEDLLMLRRHEKDFFLRKDPSYVSKAKERLELIRSKLIKTNLNPHKKSNYNQALDNYEDLFDSIVIIEKKLGLNFNNGIRKDMRNQSQLTKKSIEIFQNEYERTIKRKLSLISVGYGISLCLLILMLLFTFSLIFTITKPVKRLNSTIKNIMQDDFSGKIQIEKYSDNSEITHLTTQINEMYHKILIMKSELEITNENIIAKNELLLEHQKFLDQIVIALDFKNKQLTDSMRYAKKIQMAFLNNPEGVNQIFPKHIVIYKPKDILSGDFYHFFEVPKLKKKFVALFDCTGHGVPGALLSIVGALLIERVLGELKEDFGPIDFIKKFDECFKHVLMSKKSFGNDAMDMSVLCFDSKLKKVEFSGARMHLIKSSNDGTVLLKGNRISIGDDIFSDKELQSHVMDIKKGDRYFCFTDGFTDQFGGIENKKIKKSGLVSLIEETKTYDINSQKTYLLSYLKNWIEQETEQTQTDDITLIGIEV